MGGGSGHPRPNGLPSRSHCFSKPSYHDSTNRELVLAQMALVMNIRDICPFSAQNHERFGGVFFIFFF